MTFRYTCAVCGDEFLSDWSLDEALDEAIDVFGDELADGAGFACEPCLTTMRAQCPAFDALYRQVGR
jgi:hypothetical protein